MVGNTHDLSSAEEQQKHLDGENHEGGGMFGSLRKKLRDSKLHDVKVCPNHASKIGTRVGLERTRLMWSIRT